MTDNQTLTLAEIQARIQQRQDGDNHQDVAAALANARAKYEFVRPLTAAAEGIIEYAANPAGRFMLGLADIDAMTRGFGRGEMVYLTGRAHSGKTQIVLQAIANNPDKHVIIFTPDEVAELVLSKLISLTHGLDAEQVEARIKAGDEEMMELVRRTARKDFQNLLVIDDTLTISQMTQAVNEAQDYWGENVDAIVYDFLELLPGEDDAQGVSAKSKSLKKWIKLIDAVGFVIHQSAKSTAPRGRAAGMDGMRYGGDTEAIFVLEVFRKMDDEDRDDWDRKSHSKTVTVNLCKNKRPPSKKGEVDLFMDPNTGFVRRLSSADMVAPTHTAIGPPTAAQVMADRATAQVSPIQNVAML